MAFVRRKAVFVPDGIELDSVRAGSRVKLIIVYTTHPLRRQQMFPVRKANAGRQHRAQSKCPTRWHRPGSQKSHARVACPARTLQSEMTALSPRPSRPMTTAHGCAEVVHQVGA